MQGDRAATQQTESTDKTLFAPRRRRRRSTKIAPFKLERYFARHEFVRPTCSALQTARA
ncbi:MAG: hypothetical protein MZU95_10730 [Desulfomicrobium escambiense]|nr:hypothetical protein [Desulfomicrobium escambiense]